MTSAAEQRDGTVERDMSAHQRGIVDTCLEEGQFESAIAVMEQLRSSHYKPPISHIRQLIYISLQPEHPPAGNDVVNAADGPSSPSKMALRKRVPSGAAVPAAHRLLMSYALTNSPETIAGALPRYDDPRRDEPTPTADDSLESAIGPESMCIPKAKCCWSFLAEGFTQRQRRVFSTPRGKGKKRAHVFEEESVETLTDVAVVGEHSWAVLDWILLLFEQDEMLTAARGLGRFSPLLLQQIPCPRNASGPRWDTEFPLRIVFYCLEQPDLRRQMTGSRLITLVRYPHTPIPPFSTNIPLTPTPPQLINLSSTPHLDLPMFVSSVFSRLTIAQSRNLLAVLFSFLSPTPAVHRFKIALCQKFLADAGGGGGAQHGGRAQIRVQPRAIRGLTRADSSGTGNDLSKCVPANTPHSPNKHPLPDYAEIQRLIGSKNLSPSSMALSLSLSSLLRIKFELLNSYGMLQSEMSSAEKDVDWSKALQGGELKGVLDVAFGDEGQLEGENRVFRDSLKAMSSVW
ncbi:hypothetical protein Hypma_010585 [Hypsizygus marmoreus]|uniref:Uncharacterized protein n=1 Tax=Hypsizygus marmoreus TaxID=39966 RepID=A0A369JTU7_HYPMA|nr:hypothetical protein Hypma_010585 [Hypsizygus marmoreus]